MGKKEKLEKEIAFLQEEFRGYFLILTALFTGEAGLLYAVVSGEKPIFVLFLAIVGFLFVLFLYAKIKNIKDNIYKNLDLLEEV